MQNRIPHWQMGGFVFTAVAGTLLHFLFDWTGGSFAAALLSAVNESIWEHLKLLFYPMVAVAVIGYFLWGRETASFWCVKLVGMLMGLALIPTMYYTYTGALGINADWFNIAIFFFAAGVAYWVETKLFQRGLSCKMSDGIVVVLICAIVALFIVFTFVPPKIPFFRDPVTGTYGFRNESA